MKYLLIIWGTLIVCQCSFSQVPRIHFEQLTTKDGLPSNEIWSMTRDKWGFIWVGTGRGLCRYDGYSFATPSATKVGYCSGLSVDSKGSIYTSVATKGLTVINANTLQEKTLLANNYKDNDKHNDMYERVFIDSFDQVWLSDYTSVKRYDISKKKMIIYELSPGNNKHQDATFFEDSKKRLWVVSESGLYQYDRKIGKLVCILGKASVLPKNKKDVRLQSAFEDKNGNIWIAEYNRGLIIFNPVTEQAIFSGAFAGDKVICGQEAIDENNTRVFFIGTEKGLGLYYPDTKLTYNLPDFYSAGIHIKTIFNDKSNGILWIGTRAGLYKYRYKNQGIQTLEISAAELKFPVDVTSILKLPDDRYLFGLSHSGALMSQPRTGQYTLCNYPLNGYTYQIRQIGERFMAFTDMGIFVYDQSLKKFSTLKAAVPMFSSTEFRDGLLDRKGRFWIANLSEGLKVVNPITSKELKLWTDMTAKSFTYKNYIKGICEGSDGKIWIATCPNGLYFFQENIENPLLSKFVDIKKLSVNKNKSLSGLCINSVSLAADGKILIASWGGVNKISPNGEILESFNYENDKLLDSYCSNICEDQRGNIWFSTNEGVHIVQPKTRRIRYISTTEGLSSNYPIGFYFDIFSDKLILGQTNLVNILNTKKLSASTTIPKIVISSMEIKGKKVNYDLTKEVILQADENSLTISFSAVNFEPASKNSYSYQLDNGESKWTDLGNQNKVSFSNISAGSHTVRLVSTNSSGQRSRTAAVIKFRIKPYFVNTWLFRCLTGLASTIIIVGLLRLRLRSIAERSRLDLQIAEWRLKALQSQMNPHFLFNSLNSVQKYLLTNQGVEGTKYLSKFAKLMRRILENSNHQYLPFSEIIETLRMYVEIESFRFNHEFKYVFNIDEDANLLEAHLPPMLLQPYVENAIWHGLMPKDGDKMLTISAKLEGTNIICSIEDNGVGRKHAPKSTNHISRGQEMTNGIFESLHRRDRKAKIEIVDLYDLNFRPAGTRVRLTVALTL